MEFINSIHLPIWLSDYLEWTVVILNLTFLVLLILEQIACWFFGIIGSILAVFLFITPDVKLYSEAILYTVYAFLGVYGWVMWHKRSQNKELVIVSWSIRNHGYAMLIGCFIWLIIGLFMKKYTDAAMPWADSFSTAFSFVATYLEAKKVLEGWFYWIVLNIFSVWLYHFREIDKMAGMMVIFAILSVVGWMRWRKQFADRSNLTLKSI